MTIFFRNYQNMPQIIQNHQYVATYIKNTNKKRETRKLTIRLLTHIRQIVVVADRHFHIRKSCPFFINQIISKRCENASHMHEYIQNMIYKQ